MNLWPRRLQSQTMLIIFVVVLLLTCILLAFLGVNFFIMSKKKKDREAHFAPREKSIKSLGTIAS